MVSRGARAPPDCSQVFVTSLIKTVLMLRFTSASAALSTAIAARDEIAFGAVVRTYLVLLCLYIPPMAADTCVDIYIYIYIIHVCI